MLLRGDQHETRGHLPLSQPNGSAGLEVIIADRNSPSKWMWRADIVLATAEGLVTNAIMRRSENVEAVRKGRAQTMTHDYKRNRTTTRFAALE